MIGFLATFVVQVLCGFITLLPHKVRLPALTMLVQACYFLRPHLRRIALKNLSFAFPQLSQSERDGILKASHREIARLVVDFARAPGLTAQWFQEHIECPFFERFVEIKRTRKKGILIVTGHLGSFELLAQMMPTRGYPISMVARPFGLKHLDRWWTAARERLGNRVITRKGAVKEFIDELSAGRDAAILFDQNVTRGHAVFTPLFGVPAATTRLVAVAALRTEAPIVVATMRYLGNDRYRVEAVECDCTDVYRSDMSTEEKVVEITLRANRQFEEMVRQFPAGWFWMHRRWRTRPQEGERDFYA